jgi:hypothetical protein
MRALSVESKKMVDEFHRVPDIIYANDPNYIAHLRQDIEKIFDPKKNKLFKDGKAIRWVFYNADGQKIGRLAAFVNPKTAHTDKQPTGGIGFFESIDDQEVADFIFDTGKTWLTEQGMEAMDGPVNFGERNQFWGCLTKNFTDMNSYAMNYNPSYYPELFENYGFKTYFEQYLYTRPVYQPVEDVFARKLERLMEREQITVKNAVGMSLEEIADNFLKVYNGAWGGHDNFKMMERKQALKIMKSMKPVMDKRILIFTFDRENEPIAFFINLPELNEIFRFVNGNLNLLGKLKFLYHKWKGTPTTMVGIVFGVVREWHGKGAEGAMIHWSGKYLTDNKLYDKIVMQWIGDFNPKMLKVAENLNSTKYREMKTYRYLFDREAKFERCPIVE